MRFQSETSFSNFSGVVSTGPGAVCSSLGKFTLPVAPDLCDYGGNNG